MSAKRFALVFALALAICGLAVHGAGSAPPACLVSNERTDFGARSLQDAIDAAAAGDALVVKGICFGGSIIDKNLTLKGVSNPAFGEPTLDGTGFSNVLIVAGIAPVVVAIERLTITHGGANGIVVGGASGTAVELSGATVRGNERSAVSWAASPVRPPAVR
jgi:hypothetical protein